MVFFLPVFLAAAALVAALPANGQRKLGDYPTVIDSSAALAMASFRMALLLPRINDTNTIVKTVKDGSIIYFNDLPSGARKGLYVRTDGKWARIANELAQWSTKGNAGTNGGSNFIGTTDNQPVSFRTNNQTRLYINQANGNIGIGTSNPVAGLHNQGALAFSIKKLSNYPAGGLIGISDATVDNFTVLSIPQTTSGQTLVLPAPAKTLPGRQLLLANSGGADFFIGAATVKAGTALPLVWNGVSWIVNSDGVLNGDFTPPYRYLAPTSLGILNSAFSGYVDGTTTDPNITAIGESALSGPYATQDVAIGTQSFRNSGGFNAGIGVDAGNGGRYNVAVGNSALSSNYGDYNIAIGNRALTYAGLSCEGNTVIGNTPFAINGNSTVKHNTVVNTNFISTNSASDNVVVGPAIGSGFNSSTALDRNTFVGAGAGSGATNCVDCTFFGNNSGSAPTNGLRNATAIGAYSNVIRNNTIILGSDDPAYYSNVGIGTSNPQYKLHVNGEIRASGNYGNTSDARLKKDVTPVRNAIDKIKQLRPVIFSWNQQAAIKAGMEVDTSRHYGFIAQEVEKVLPQVVNTGRDSLHTKAVAYSDIVPVLIQAVQDQQPMISELRLKIKNMRQRLLRLQKEITSMTQIK